MRLGWIFFVGVLAGCHVEAQNSETGGGKPVPLPPTATKRGERPSRLDNRVAFQRFVNSQGGRLGQFNKETRSRATGGWRPIGRPPVSSRYDPFPRANDLERPLSHPAVLERPKKNLVSIPSSKPAAQKMKAKNPPPENPNANPEIPSTKGSASNSEMTWTTKNAQSPNTLPSSQSTASLGSTPTKSPTATNNVNAENIVKPESTGGTSTGTDSGRKMTLAESFSRLHSAWKAIQSQTQAQPTAATPGPTKPASDLTPAPIVMIHHNEKPAPKQVISTHQAGFVNVEGNPGMNIKQKLVQGTPETVYGKISSAQTIDGQVKYQAKFQSNKTISDGNGRENTNNLNSNGNYMNNGGVNSLRVKSFEVNNAQDKNFKAQITKDNTHFRKDTFNQKQEVVGTGRAGPIQSPVSKIHPPVLTRDEVGDGKATRSGTSSGRDINGTGSRAHGLSGRYSSYSIYVDSQSVEAHIEQGKPSVDRQGHRQGFISKEVDNSHSAFHGASTSHGSLTAYGASTLHGESMQHGTSESHDASKSHGSASSSQGASTSHDTSMSHEASKSHGSASSSQGASTSHGTSMSHDTSKSHGSASSSQGASTSHGTSMLHDTSKSHGSASSSQGASASHGASSSNGSPSKSQGASLSHGGSASDSASVSKGVSRSHGSAFSSHDTSQSHGRSFTPRDSLKLTGTAPASHKTATESNGVTSSAKGNKASEQEFGSKSHGSVSTGAGSMGLESKPHKANMAEGPASSSGGPIKTPCRIAPICGSDGFTYMSECFLAVGVTAACEGFCPCKPPSETPKQPQPPNKPGFEGNHGTKLSDSLKKHHIPVDEPRPHLRHGTNQKSPNPSQPTPRPLARPPFLKRRPVGLKPPPPPQNRGGSNTDIGQVPLDKAPVCACPLNIDPVCGINGRTYDNDCLRRCANVPEDCVGECPCTQTLPHYSASTTQGGKTGSSNGNGAQHAGSNSNRAQAVGNHNNGAQATGSHGYGVHSAGSHGNGAHAIDVPVGSKPYTCADYCPAHSIPVCSTWGHTFENDCIRDCSGEPFDCEGVCPCPHDVYRHNPTHNTVSSAGPAHDPFTGYDTNVYPDVNNEPSNQPVNTCNCRAGDIDPVCTIDGQTLWYGCMAICQGATIACSSECPC